MNKFILASLLWSGFEVHAAVLAPAGQEVDFSFTAEFQSRQLKTAVDLITNHVEHLFGFLQAKELNVQFGVPTATPGLGGLSWPPRFRLLGDTPSNGMRTIRYQVKGKILLHNSAATRLLRQIDWLVPLPYDLDNYYEYKCSEWGSENSRAGFWYFYNPFLPGCEFLTRPPLARDVAIHLTPRQAPSLDLRAELGDLRGDNGNGELFQITTINGFDVNTRRRDEGRKGYEALNHWLRSQGFHDKVAVGHKSHVVHEFSKSIQRLDGSRVEVHISRLLAHTDLAGKSKVFAQFFRQALQSADVLIYAGHSGDSVALNLAEVEAKAGPVKFDSAKKQIFFFDACSGYAYYLPIFWDRPHSSDLRVLTFGLSSEFGFELSMHSALLRYLLDTRQESPRWMDIATEIERPLGGATYLLNVWIPDANEDGAVKEKWSSLPAMTIFPTAR